MTMNNSTYQLKNSQPFAGLSLLWLFVLLDELRKSRETLEWFVSAPTLQHSKLRNREVKALSLLESGAQITGRHEKSAQGS